MLVSCYIHVWYFKEPGTQFEPVNKFICHCFCFSIAGVVDTRRTIITIGRGFRDAMVPACV